ncbi:MAG: VacJ family lipoprotein [Rubellimicrobium sp.]|nr:VacJ family lipoprotein [Rubellimicrobium sp.]
MVVPRSGGRVLRITLQLPTPRRWIVAALAALSLAACGAAPPTEAINDPWEANNRAVHEFNKGLDQALLRPAGRASAHLPEVIRVPVTNFAANAGLPSAIVNNVLQGDIGGAATNIMRFVLNTTVGVLGLADPAGAIGLYEVEADFGGTLARWGVPEGAYLELPVLGPSTERDAAGQLVDYVLDPLGRLDNPRLDPIRRGEWPAWAAGRVIDRGQFSDTVDSVLYESADSYAQARLIYLQNRRFQLGQGAGDDHVDPYADSTAYIDPYEDQP